MQHDPRLELSRVVLGERGQDVACATPGGMGEWEEERSHFETGFWQKTRNCLGDCAPSGGAMSPLMEVAGGFLWG